MTKLLDCTLRDGGYVNDWNFGKGTINSIIERLNESNVDFVEIGFLDDRVEKNTERSIQPNTAAFKDVIDEPELFSGKLIAMIDYGTCDIDNIEDASQAIIAGIRLIFKKEKYDGAIEYAKKLIKKGYLVFLQMVSITSYQDEDLKDFSNKVNLIQPFAVSIVDTYGLMHKKDMLSYLNKLDDLLDSKIRIGYHSHNNFQLAYANSIEFIEYETKREKIIDGTLYGMGKSAGNAPLELLAMFLNENDRNRYELNQIMEAIDNNILNIYQEKYWGYNMHFYISSLNDCHPNYPKYLLDKNTLSIKSINEILCKIPGDKKLHYDPEYIEKLYLNYQDKEINDEFEIKQIKKLIDKRNILLIGPGKSIISEKETIDSFIKENNPLMISANMPSPSIMTDYIFISNSKRYNISHDCLANSGCKLIGTSNITQLDSCKFDYIVNYNELKNNNGDEIDDNSLCMMLSMLIRVDCPSVTLAGFDGYSKNIKMDYVRDNMAISQKISYNEINKKITRDVNKLMKKIDVRFLTKSVYDSYEKI